MVTLSSAGLLKQFDFSALFYARTGTTRRSNESIEMQPLHGNATSGGGSGGADSGGSAGSGGSKTSKTMLKRMPRVKSDDIHTEDEGKDNDKVPSPIGAGLPLLQRLRLLKEKQVSGSFYLITIFIHQSLYNTHDHPHRQGYIPHSGANLHLHHLHSHIIVASSSNLLIRLTMCQSLRLAQHFHQQVTTHISPHHTLTPNTQARIYSLSLSTLHVPVLLRDNSSPAHNQSHPI